MRTVRRWIFLCFGVLAIQFAAPATYAAISPSNIKRMKEEATVVLQVTITEATVTQTDVKLGYWRKVVAYTATVTEVTRSTSGTKRDDSITIHSYRLGGLLPPGPKNPPMLQEGWQGTVYLNRTEGDKQFRIGLHGHSFEATEEGE